VDRHGAALCVGCGHVQSATCLRCGRAEWRDEAPPASVPAQVFHPTKTTTEHEHTDGCRPEGHALDAPTKWRCSDGVTRYPALVPMPVPQREARVEAAQARVKALEDAIKAHRAQRADDRCVEDDDRLYAVLGDGIACDRRVGDKAEMLRNCARFIERRCEAGGWPTYADLEAENATMRAAVAEDETP